MRENLPSTVASAAPMAKRIVAPHSAHSTFLCHASQDVFHLLCGLLHVLLSCAQVPLRSNARLHFAHLLHQRFETSKLGFVKQIRLFDRVKQISTLPSTSQHDRPESEALTQVAFVSAYHGSTSCLEPKSCVRKNIDNRHHQVRPALRSMFFRTRIERLDHPHLPTVWSCRTA